MLNTLVEQGWYKQPNLSPIRSVQLADFEDAVFRLSIHNGKQYAAYG